MGVGWKIGCLFLLSLLVMKYILGYDHDSRLILAAVLAVCYGFQLLSKQAQIPIEKKNKEIVGATTPVALEDEPELSFDMATNKIRNHSGWNTWTVYPTQKRIVNEFCYGGPPTWHKTFEYEIRDETVLVRLVESSKESVDSPNFEVFNGVINLDYLEKEYHREKIRWGEDSPLLETPDMQRAWLEKQTAWHEMLGAARYIMLSVNGGHHNFFGNERERLSKAFETIAEEAKQLGADWDEDSGRYQAPAAATKEEKDVIESAITHLYEPEKLRKLKVEYVELQQFGPSMKVLADALGKNHEQRA
jgi:hypothetical protein